MARLCHGVFPLPMERDTVSVRPKWLIVVSVHTSLRDRGLNKRISACKFYKPDLRVFVLGTVACGRDGHILTAYFCTGYIKIVGSAKGLPSIRNRSDGSRGDLSKKITEELNQRIPKEPEEQKVDVN